MDKKLQMQNSMNTGKIFLGLKNWLPTSLTRTTWFNQEDVDNLKEVGINTVRIPVSFNFSAGYECLFMSYQLGYWIVEELVNRTSEFYPKGGLAQLVRYLDIISFRRTILLVYI